MSTALPAATDFNGASVTEGQFKTAQGAFRDFVAELQTKASDVVSAATTAIGAAAGNYVKITGSNTITAFDNPTAAPNVTRTCLFAAALTLTHNATSLILPGSVNITTAAGDVGIFVHEGGGNWRCVSYQRQSGGLKWNATTAPSLVGTYDASLAATDDTHVRLSLKGSDGITRTLTLTVAP
jgi:hypothetical protein